jgi:hypothetical protein
MQRITLKDSRFRIIGYVDIAPNGDKTLRNERFQILGYYKANRDYDKRKELLEAVGISITYEDLKKLY